MSALKNARWLVLAGALGCEGPTLYVGDFQPLDAGPSFDEDAATPQDARVIVRDAQADGRVDVIVVQRCARDEDCRDARLAHCNTNFFVCTNCQYDRDCKQGEYCDMSAFVWQCRTDDDHHGSDMSGGPGSTVGGP